MDVFFTVLRVLTWTVIAIILARVLLSWLPRNWMEREPLRTIQHWLHVITEPVFSPMRKVFKPVGPARVKFDVAPMLVLLLCEIIVLPALA